MSALDADELASRVHAINERGMVVLNAARCEEKAREDQTVGLGVFTGVTLAALRSDHSAARRARAASAAPSAWSG